MSFFTKGRIIVILAVLLALMMGVFGGFTLLSLVSANGSPVAVASGSNTAQEDAAKNGESKAEPGMMYPMAERVLNLADTVSFRYVKVQVVVEFDLPDARGLKGEAYKKRQDEFAKELASRRPKFDDILTTVVGGKTASSLSSNEGREKLRDELKTKMDEAAGEHRITNVYFTQFIIQ